MTDEFDLKPTSRGEEFLDVILRSLGGDTPDIPQPAWRYEEYLAAIANAIQNGGGGSSGGGAVVEMYYDNDLSCFVTDKTAEQIVQAASTGPVSMHYYSHDDALDLYLPVIIKSMGEDPKAYELYTNSLAFGADVLLLDVDNHAHWIYPD